VPALARVAVNVASHGNFEVSRFTQHAPFRIAAKKTDETVACRRPVRHGTFALASEKMSQ
jgi:hypothetical protein